MAPPRRRRRFSALGEDKHQAQISGLTLPNTGSTSDDPSPSSVDEDEVIDSAPETLSADPTTVDLESDSTASDALPPGFQLLREGRPRPKARRRFTATFWLLALGCLVAGLLGGYFLGRLSGKGNDAGTRPGPKKEVVPLTPAEQHDLDAAFAARHEGRFAEAKQLFTALAHSRGWGVMEVEIGRTLLYENDQRESGNVLEAVLEKGSAAAEATFLLASRHNRLNNYPEAEADFARAVALDPTQPNYYYFWGECLRGQGKVLEAIPKFRSALLCNQYETATGLYRLKLWLCEIEAGQEDADGVRREIDTALAQPFPPMEALFAAAARTFKAGDTKDALALIVSARQRSDPTVFPIILHDPFFAALRLRPEFSEVLGSGSSPSGAKAGEATTLPPSVSSEPTPSAHDTSPLPATGKP